jgi:carbon storage regulator
MLVLSRRQGEKIVIGDNITVTVVKVKGSGTVAIGVEAPTTILVRRSELVEYEDPMSAKRPKSPKPTRKRK